ncbi:MAG: hypothetical protein ACI4MS_03215 [Candidatus Coproplasma sp.]
MLFSVFFLGKDMQELKSGANSAGSTAEQTTVAPVVWRCVCATATTPVIRTKTQAIAFATACVFFEWICRS